MWGGVCVRRLCQFGRGHVLPEEADQTQPPYLMNEEKYGNTETQLAATDGVTSKLNTRCKKNFNFNYGRTLSTDGRDKRSHLLDKLWITQITE